MRGGRYGHTFRECDESNRQVREHDALVESEKNKALLQAKMEEENIKKEAEAHAAHEVKKEVSAEDEETKKKAGAVNMNIK